MSWKSLSLGEALSVKHGFAFKSTYFSDQGSYLVLTPGNFREQGGFQLRTGKDRWYSGYFPEEYILGERDILVAMTEQGPGLLGSSAIVPEGNLYLHNQRLGLVTDLDESVLDRKFTYYLFNTRSVRAQISSSASGTKVRHTSPGRIYKVRVPVPCVESQARIADILSAYDDLIENNRRRIALLEQTARELYREWFVRLRFPGHESARVVDGLPKGWETKTLGKVADIRGGKQFGGEELDDSHEYPVFGGNGIQGYSSKSTHSGFVIVFGRVGVNCGSIHWSYDGGWVNNNASSIVPRYFNELVLQHLLHYNFSHLRKGAAQPFIPNGLLSTVRFVIPRKELSVQYCNLVLGIRIQQTNLHQQTRDLARARDLLLPRLMSGEVPG